MPRLPLDGIRILDLTQIWAGPYCTLLLGGLGAEVIKVESVQRPEPLRASPSDGEVAAPWESSYLYQTFNLNKLGITLDLMSPTGRELFLDLAGLSDIVIENFTVGVMDRWGLAYQTLKDRRPDIIFLSMPGFGSTGPYAGYRALGTTMEAMSGVAWMTGYPGGPPMRCGLNYGDPIAALYAAFALLAALRYRLETGLGQRLELSQLEGLISLLPEPLLEYGVNGRIVERGGNGHPCLAPHGCYPCRGEDQWVTVAVASDKEWQALCHLLGRPNLATDHRFSDAMSRWKHREELDAVITQWTRRHGPQEAMQLLQEAGVAAGAVQTTAELLRDPQLQSRDAFRKVLHPMTGETLFRNIPWKFSGTPGGIQKRPPLLGEHNAFVLGELMGLPAREVDELHRGDVIGDRPLAA